MSADTPHVLVVDDEADLRELLVITLGRMKLKASAAESLHAAKEALSNNTFDLCLTDMNLGTARVWSFCTSFPGNARRCPPQSSRPMAAWKPPLTR